MDPNRRNNAAFELPDNSMSPPNGASGLKPGIGNNGAPGFNPLTPGGFGGPPVMGGAGPFGGGIASGFRAGQTSTTTQQQSSTTTTTQQSSSYSSETIQSSTQSLGLALTQVPWMRFKVIAEPDMSLFASDARLQAFIQSITETTVASVTQEIMNEFTSTLEQAIVKINQSITARMSTVTESVIAQITSLTNIPGGVTGLQPLCHDGIIGVPGIGGTNIPNGLGGVGGIPVFGPAPGIGGIPVFVPVPGVGGGSDGNGPGRTVIIIDNCGKKHAPGCPNDHNRGHCSCPANDSCPMLYPNQKPATVAPPDLTKAAWIWTKEVVGAPGGVLRGMARPFRKTISSRCPVNRLTIDIVCDDAYTLYVNGKLVGSGSNWTIAQRYTVRFGDTNKVVVAVYAIQGPISMAQVGLVCAGVVWNSQERGPVRTVFETDDTTWKTYPADDFDRTFFERDFDDWSWENAVSEGAFPTTPPWAGKVVLPTTQSPNGPGSKNIPGSPKIPDAPEAEPADVITSNEGSNGTPADHTPVMESEKDQRSRKDLATPGSGRSSVLKNSRGN